MTDGVDELFRSPIASYNVADARVSGPMAAGGLSLLAMEDSAERTPGDLRRRPGGRWTARPVRRRRLSALRRLRCRWRAALGLRPLRKIGDSSPISARRLCALPPGVLTSGPPQTMERPPGRACARRRGSFRCADDRDGRSTQAGREALGARPLSLRRRAHRERPAASRDAVRAAGALQIVSVDIERRSSSSLATAPRSTGGAVRPVSLATSRGCTGSWARR